MHYIYLFSRKGNSYIVNLEDIEEDNFALHKRDLSQFKLVDVLCDNSLIELMDELAKRHCYFAAIFTNIKEELVEKMEIEQNITVI